MFSFLTPGNSKITMMLGKDGSSIRFILGEASIIMILASVWFVELPWLPTAATLLVSPSRTKNTGFDELMYFGLHTPKNCVFKSARSLLGRRINECWRIRRHYEEDLRNTIVSVLGFIYKRRTPNTAKSTGDSKK